MMRLLAILFLCSSLVSYGGTIDPGNADQQYIDNGKTFVSVGRLCGKDSSGQYYCASAVAIKPRWILTAAHVVKNVKSCQITINNKKINVEKLLPHKNFEYDNFGEYDIALGKCSDDIGLDNYPDLYENNDEVDKTCSISGYGLHGTFLTGCKKFDDKKRAGTNRIDYIDRHIMICSASIGENKTSLEFIIASGDSGGGLFIDSKLAGINSCVMAKDKVPDSSYGDEGCHTRVSIFKPWIESVIEKDTEY